MARPIARIATTEGRMVTVVRHPYHVGLHDHADPAAHAGWTLHREDAHRLGEALIKAAADPPEQGSIN